MHVDSSQVYGMPLTDSFIYNNDIRVPNAMGCALSSEICAGIQKEIPKVHKLTSYTWDFLKDKCYNKHTTHYNNQSAPWPLEVLICLLHCLPVCDQIATRNNSNFIRHIGI